MSAIRGDDHRCGLRRSSQHLGQCQPGRQSQGGTVRPRQRNPVHPAAGGHGRTVPTVRHRLAHHRRRPRPRARPSLGRGGTQRRPDQPTRRTGPPSAPTGCRRSPSSACCPTRRRPGRMQRSRPSCTWTCWSTISIRPSAAFCVLARHYWKVRTSRSATGSTPTQPAIHSASSRRSRFPGIHGVTAATGTATPGRKRARRVETRAHDADGRLLLQTGPAGNPCSAWTSSMSLRATSLVAHALRGIMRMFGRGALTVREEGSTGLRRIRSARAEMTRMDPSALISFGSALIAIVALILSAGRGNIRRRRGATGAVGPGRTSLRPRPRRRCPKGLPSGPRLAHPRPDRVSHPSGAAPQDVTVVRLLGGSSCRSRSGSRRRRSAAVRSFRNTSRR